MCVVEPSTTSATTLSSTALTSTSGTTETTSTGTTTSIGTTTSTSEYHSYLSYSENELKVDMQSIGLAVSNH